MFKLVLEKAEEPEIKLPTSTGSWTKQEFQKTSISALLIYKVHHAKCWLDEAQAGITIAGRNTSNLSYVEDTMLMAESKEGTK